MRRFGPQPPPPTPKTVVAPSGLPWWTALLALGAVAVACLAAAVAVGQGSAIFERSTKPWWVLTALLHPPFAILIVFLIGGLVERLGYFVSGRSPHRPGQLPEQLPFVCVQLPLFNEHAVSQRLIETACAMHWDRARLVVQVLDDSTDIEVRRVVDATAARMRRQGVDCRVLRRPERTGYKAGALEVGRRRTNADFLAIFDADFLPPADFLLRTVAHFYDRAGQAHDDLALVQAQWGHLNAEQSALTRAQSLWVDDHHTLQISWRSATWQFVNFTGTAGVWRASAIAAAGGWRAASLVEDCELSFLCHFAGYRTRFVKEIVAPAELPATFTAYKAQLKRWTQGWVQLQRLHLGHLLFRHECGLLQRMHLADHMCISTQWPLWGVWMILLPLLISTGHWLGVYGAGVGAVAYLAPVLSWLVVSTTLATVETRHTYADRLSPRVFGRRFARIVPYVVLNSGMLPHQVCAFFEGLSGPMHSEFERTPKSATVLSSALDASPEGRKRGLAKPAQSPTRSRSGVKIHWPYVAAEAGFVLIPVVLGGLVRTTRSVSLRGRSGLSRRMRAGCCVLLRRPRRQGLLRDRPSPPPATRVAAPQLVNHRRRSIDSIVVADRSTTTRIHPRAEAVDRSAVEHRNG